MEELNTERKVIVVSAAAFLKCVNDGGAGQRSLRRPIKRQAFYNTMLPIFAAQGLVIANGRKRSIIIGFEGDDCYGAGSLIGKWQHYARVREAMVANGVWIGRRNWSWEDMQAAQNMPIPAIVPLEAKIQPLAAQ